MKRDEQALNEAVEAELERMKSEAPENYYMDGEYTEMGLTIDTLDDYWREQLRARLAPKMGYKGK